MNYPGKGPLYLVSSEFDYTRLICADVGPGYAASLGLECGSISELDDMDLSGLARAVIIDGRISEREYEILGKFIRGFEGVKWIFRVVDPFYVYARSYKFISTLCALSSQANVGLLLAYQPIEITALLATMYQSRVHVSNYPYCQENELARKHDGRKNQIIISGANDQSIYPLRAVARHKRRWNPVWWSITDDLAHPGYRDLNSREKHKIVGSVYLGLLSKYRMMLACPSYLHLEFLKFNEAAYAGCCPVGVAAATLPPAAKEAMIRLDIDDWSKCLRDLRGMSRDEVEHRALLYRKAMAMERSPAMLLANLNHWLASW